VGVIQVSQGEKATVVILQPGYLPWLGFFDQMYQSDIFVIYDDVQFDKDGWRNRNRIKTAQGEQWLTVPVLTKGLDKPLINEILVNNAAKWQKKHLTSIRQSYSKAPFFAQYIDGFEEILTKEWKYLVDLDMAFIYRLAGWLGLERDIRFSSDMGIPGQSSERLVAMCAQLGAERFFEGAAGQDYLDVSLFKAQGIQVEYQDYQHPVYAQLHGEFIPYLSVIDLLFNHGPDSLNILINKEVTRKETSAS
jgi:hypothetical protein